MSLQNNYKRLQKIKVFTINFINTYTIKMNKELIISAALSIIFLAACSDNNKEKLTIEALPITEGKQTSINNNASNVSSSVSVLPFFSVQDVKGKTFNLQSLKGKKVFVNLWASWCPPCRVEMPSIEKLYRSADSNKVAFVILSMDDDFEQSKEFIQNQKLNLPIYYPAESLPALFTTPGIPATFIFNENGKLIKRIDGGDDYDTEVYKLLLR